MLPTRMFRLPRALRNKFRGVRGRAALAFITAPRRPWARAAALNRAIHVPPGQGPHDPLLPEHSRHQHELQKQKQQEPPRESENENDDSLPDQGKRLPLRRRLANAWNNTPTKWYPLPVGIGALLLAVIQFRKRKDIEEDDLSEMHPRVKLQGGWQVHVLGALPLRNLSRLWGYLNSLELPIWLRPTGFRVYAWFFGCNLDEIEHEDLTHYKSLGAFFYRKLKDGVRPIATADLVSPADGTVLHFGVIENHQVEQVKGLTYSLDALLGSSSIQESHNVEFGERDPDLAAVDDHEFANVNGIEYSLDRLIGQEKGQRAVSLSRPPASDSGSSDEEDNTPLTPFDASFPPSGSSTDDQASVALQMGTSSVRRMPQRVTAGVKKENELYFAVIYLAPGDYHRFHSPAPWVVEKRRHFAGELFSVSPFMAKRLANLFVLNERVALLGRWKYGFFGMVPVGATNVGSIKINFDKTLRTNLRRRPLPAGSYTEARYTAASPVLGGQPLRPGQEMGGFELGSTIVLVFEAPKTFKFELQAGQKIKVGEKMGNVEA